jgi:hypothetical protein
MSSDVNVVNLDLDVVERESVRGVPKRKDPYRVKVDGKVLTFADPMEIDAAELMVMEDTPGRFFKATITDDDEYAHMIEVFQTPGKLPGIKLRALMTGYRTYYGLDDPGNVGGSRR